MAPLLYDPNWRFMHPAAGIQIALVAVWEDLYELIVKIALQGEAYRVYETFKRMFSNVTGDPYFQSSSVDWAKSDLQGLMQVAAKNPPLFIEAFYDACQSLSTGHSVPSVDIINRSLHDAGYIIDARSDPPTLLFQTDRDIVALPETPQILTETFRDVYRDSINTAESLLSQGQFSPAVQVYLWLLESISTAFRGVEMENKDINAKYFNTIVKELRAVAQSGFMDIALGWMVSLHGYLSSPTGGGIRHGVDLNEGHILAQNEARLIIDLVRSYIRYLLSEHERLTQGDKAS